MLVNITFSLRDETVERLRAAAKGPGGARKGAISEIVEAAIDEHLRDMESRGAREEFRALVGGKVVASAYSLRLLSAELARLKLDPREALIESSRPQTATRRTGLRGHSD
jgi:predicted DNA-binding protein